MVRQLGFKFNGYASHSIAYTFVKVRSALVAVKPGAVACLLHNSEIAAKCICKMIAKFIRDIILFLLVSGLSRLLPFLLTPIFTHYLVPQEMGKLELILSLYTIFMVFGMCQLDTSFQRYFYNGVGVSRSVVVGVTKLSIATTLFFFAAIPILISLLSLSHDSFNALAIAGASIPFANLHIINSLIIRYSRPIKYVILINVLQTTLFATLACIVIVKLKWGVEGYFFALLFSYVISVLISFGMIKDQLLTAIDKLDEKKIWQFALPQMPARIASVIAQYGNRFVLYIIFTQATIGVFSIASKMSALMLVGLSAFCMVWYPLLYQKSESTKKDIIQIFKVVIIFMPVVVIGLFCISKYIFAFYISTDYSEAEFPTYIMILAASLLIIKEMVDAGIKISEKSKYISYIYIGNTIVLFLLILFLGAVWGLNGVAYSMLISNIILTYSTWFVAESLHPMKFDMRYCHSYVIFCLICTFLTKSLMLG